MLMPMNGESFLTLPSSNRTNAATQICGDLFPAVEAFAAITRRRNHFDRRTRVAWRAAGVGQSGPSPRRLTLSSWRDVRRTYLRSEMDGFSFLEWRLQCSH